MRTIATALSLFSCAIALSSCQPQGKTVAQQQHFICKALIEGFLKTQNLTDYQFLSLAPSLTETSTQRTYQYRLNNEREMQMNLPHQKNLQFQIYGIKYTIFQLKSNTTLIKFMVWNFVVN